MEEPGRLHDAALVRIRQPDRTGGAALPVADEKGRRRESRTEDNIAYVGDVSVRVPLPPHLQIRG
jgi:hypothetical protein